MVQLNFSFEQVENLSFSRATVIAHVIEATKLTLFRVAVALFEVPKPTLVPPKPITTINYHVWTQSRRLGRHLVISAPPSPTTGSRDTLVSAHFLFTA